MKRRVLCGIWVKGKHCAFTDRSPACGASYSIGRMRSLPVNAHSTDLILQTRFHRCGVVLEMPQTRARCKIMEALLRQSIMSVDVSPLEIVGPPLLEGSMVRLEPLRREHARILWEVAREKLDDIFQWIPYRMQTIEDFHKLVERAFAEQERGESVVFATVERRSGQVVGSTRFMNIDRDNRRVEVGSTWIAPAWQRTGVNTEAKYLMLRHAFEAWKCMRVELKTDALNRRSRNAILRIGAKEEGTLRKHLITWTGRVRDSVYFSILDSEWADVKARLEVMLARKCVSENV
jgi:N-acetyltransferase